MNYICFQHFKYQKFSRKKFLEGQTDLSIGLFLVKYKEG